MISETFRHHGARCRLTLDGGIAHLDKVWCRDEVRGQGYADIVLRMAMERADDLGIAVHLFVVPHCGSEENRLITWYRRHGFVMIDHGANAMVRPARR